jgi:hypothetical protein
MYNQNNETSNALKKVQQGLTKVVNAGLFELMAERVQTETSDGGVTYKFMSRGSLAIPKCEELDKSTLCVIFAGDHGGACSLDEVQQNAPLLIKLLKIEV